MTAADVHPNGVGNGAAPTGITQRRDSSFDADEWALLASHWHPVGASRELDATLLRTTLLDVGLVAWRDASGAAVVAPDRCPHRSARLSAGTLADGTVTCPYHGMQFGEAGHCTLVPSAGPGAPISSRLDLRTIPVIERYGLVWACLSGRPAGALPDWSEIEQPGLLHGVCAPAVWGSSALRHVENFNDQAHFPFVHDGTFGVPDAQLVGPLSVDVRGSVLVLDVVATQLERDTFDGPEMPVEVAYHYEWSLPFSCLLRAEFPGLGTGWVIDVAAPVTANTSRVYLDIHRNFDTDAPLGPFVEFQDAVNDEDRRILELLEPSGSFAELTSEVDVKADAMSIAARRWFAASLAAISTGGEPSRIPESPDAPMVAGRAGARGR